MAIKKTKNKSYANRGKFLQEYINAANNSYRARGQAEINEIATPTKNIDGKIKYVAKSTVDYVGLSHTRSIAFDAKSTQERTRFPLDNVEEHQVNFLKRWQDQGGISFFIIHFTVLHETYYVPFDFFMDYWEASKRTIDKGPQSIQIGDFRLHCSKITAGRGLTLDYLPHCFK